MSVFRRTGLPLLLALALAACDVGTATSPGGATSPRITGVSPQAPLASSAAQTLLIRGERFLTGLSLNLVTPGGATLTVSSSAISALEPSSFEATVVLATPGNYALTVRNSTGEVSPAFVLGVLGGAEGTAPTISVVLPSSLTRSTLTQILTVQGTNFVPGLAVSVIDPDGLVGTQSGSAVDSVTQTSFQFSMVFGKVGTYSLRVVNPSGESSNSVNVVVGQ